MSFSFTAPRTPLILRICRTLIWVQALLIILAGISVILAVLLFGGNGSIPLGNRALSGSGAEILGGVYVGAGIGLFAIGAGVARARPWARLSAVCIQLFLAILLVARSLDVSVSTFLNAGLFIAIVVLLYLPPTRAAFGRPASPQPQPGID
ncbi:MAG: hypothetical protein ACYDAC_03520 [Candidatus Dormibacteria bacterium]